MSTGPKQAVWAPFGNTFLLWGSGLLVALVLAGAALVPDAGTTVSTVLAAVAAGFVAFLLLVLPWAVTEHGIRVDAAGVSFEQRPKWWSRGRLLHVPWDEIVAVVNVDAAEGMRKTSDRGADDRELSFYLYDLPLGKRSPTWVRFVMEDGDHLDEPTLEAFPRVAVVFRADQTVRIIDAVGVWRPDLVEPTSPVHQPTALDPTGQIPETTDRLPEATAHASEAVNQVARPSDEPDHGTVDCGGPQVCTWLVLTCVAAFFVMVTLLTGIFALEVAAEPVPGSVAGLAFSAVFALLLLGALITLTVLAPRTLTVHGIRVDRHGITLFRSPKWWFHGQSAHVPWEDVHLVEAHVMGRRSTTTRVEVHLYGGRSDLRLPPWAQLVPTGGKKWMFSADRHPVLLVMPPGRLGTDRLLALVRRIRPDLMTEHLRRGKPPRPLED
ncbi:hypothetical protein [Nocardiopsis oceani]